MGYPARKLKNTDNLEDFKKKVKSWKPDNCPCTLIL